MIINFTGIEKEHDFLPYPFELQPLNCGDYLKALKMSIKILVHIATLKKVTLHRNILESDSRNHTTKT